MSIENFKNPWAAEDSIWFNEELNKFNNFSLIDKKDNNSKGVDKNQKNKPQHIESNGFKIQMIGELNKFPAKGKINNISLDVKVTGENINRIDFHQFVQVTFSGTDWEKSKSELENLFGPNDEYVYNGYVYNKVANTALFLDPGQKGSTYYYTELEKDEQFKEGLYVISSDGKYGRAPFTDAPDNVNHINNGFKRVLFTTYISVTTTNSLTKILGKVYWSYNYDEKTKSWTPNNSDTTPYLIKVEDGLSAAAQKVLDNMFEP